jgi:hypothetical protein
MLPALEAYSWLFQLWLYVNLEGWPPNQFGGKYTDDVWVESPEKTYDSLGM